MDTPFKSDGFKRRKLKKIMKRKEVNLHSSLSSNSYQKKVKAAINVSLNSTRNVRTLQANNRSLANGLEKWKQECRSAQDKCNYLLQVNHDLREHILQLERKLSASPSFIKEEIEKQCKLRMNKIENDIKGLFSCAQGFIEHILRVMKSYTEEPPEEPLLSNLSLPNSLHLSTSQCIDEEYDEEVGPIYKRTQSKDLSMITEQSICFQPGEQFSMDIIAEDPVQATQKPLEKLFSKLPLRIPVKSKDQSLRPTELEKNNEIICSMSPEQTFSKSSPTTKRSPATSTGLKAPVNSPVNKENLTNMKGKSHLPKAQKTAYLNSRSPKSPKKVSAKKSKKLLLSKASPKKDNPIITNEFTLVNSFLEMTKKRQMLEQNEKNECQVKSPTADADHTNLCVIDMELTSLDTMPLISSIVDSTKTCTVDVPLASKTQSADNCDPMEAPTVDELVWADQKFPDAVTLRRGKPGQFNFAVSRKESDGTRKSLPLTAPAKSRSRKKKISDKPIHANFPSPQNIFDFHDKTPKGLNETRSKDVSIFNITGDVTTSPLPPLSKFRQNKTNDEKVENLTQQAAGIVTSPDKFFSLLSKEPEYQLPLKGSPVSKKNSPKSMRRSRSQSRSKKKKGEDKDNKGRAHSEGRKSNLLVTSPVKDLQSISKRVRSKSKANKDSPARSKSKGDKDSPARSKSKADKDSPARSKSKADKDSPARLKNKADKDSPTRLKSKADKDSPARSKNKTDKNSPSRSKSKAVKDSPARSKSKADKNSPSSGDKEVKSRRQTFVLSKVKGTGEEDCKNDPVSPTQQPTKKFVQQRRTQRVSFMDIPEQSQNVDETFSLLSSLDKTEETNVTREKMEQDVELSNNNQEVVQAKKTPSMSVGIQKGKAIVKILKEKEQQIISTKAQQNSSTKEQLITSTKEQPITSTKEQPITSTKEQPITSTKEQPITSTKEQPITSTKEQPITSTKEQPITSTKEQQVNSAKEQPITDSKEHIASSWSANNNNAAENSQNQEENNMNRDSTSRLLMKLKHLKTPKLSVTVGNVSESEVKVTNETSTAAKKKKCKTDKSPVKEIKASVCKNLSEKDFVKAATLSTTEQSSPQMRTAKSASAKLIHKKTLADIDPNTCKLPEPMTTNKSPPNLKRGLEIQCLSPDVPEVKKRRAATKIQSYVEPSLNSKLRRGDPMSSHYCTSENIPIYKEKIRVKVKKVPATNLEPVHNQSIQEEN